MQQLWKKLLQTLTEKINGTVMMIGKRIYFNKNKKSLKSKDDNKISLDKKINCMINIMLDFQSNR